MNKQEVNNLLALLKVNYSYAFKAMSRDEKVLMLNSWTFALQDLDADIVTLAVMKLLTVSKWVPTVAEIRKKVQAMYFEAMNDLQVEPWEECLYSREQIASIRAMQDNIIRQCGPLRGDREPELSLRDIAGNPQYAGLMRGNDQMMALTGDTFRLDDPEEGGGEDGQQDED